MSGQPAIEPVTDDDLRAAQNIGERPGQIRLVTILLADRRRVAERQAPEIERLRAEVASLRALVGTVRDTLGLRTINVADIDYEAHSREIGAKVARLSAACAQMRGALEQAPRLLEAGKAIQYYSDPKLHPLCEENFTFLDRARKAEVRIGRAIDEALSLDTGKV